MVSASGSTLSEMMTDFPTYVSTPEIRIDVTEEQKWDVVKEAATHFGKIYKVLTVDGARIQFADGWALLRASNTQPIIVARFEAGTEKRLSEIREEIDLWLQAHGLSLP
jgi:phosphomannomutase/phosphoglucomutase